MIYFTESKQFISEIIHKFSDYLPSKQVVTSFGFFYLLQSGTAFAGITQNNNNLHNRINSNDIRNGTSLYPLPQAIDNYVSQIFQNNQVLGGTEVDTENEQAHRDPLLQAIDFSIFFAQLPLTMQKKIDKTKSYKIWKDLFYYVNNVVITDNKSYVNVLQSQKVSSLITKLKKVGYNKEEITGILNLPKISRPEALIYERIITAVCYKHSEDSFIIISEAIKEYLHLKANVQNQNLNGPSLNDVLESVIDLFKDDLQEFSAYLFELMEIKFKKKHSLIAEDNFNLNELTFQENHLNKESLLRNAIREILTIGPKPTTNVTLNELTQRMFVIFRLYTVIIKDIRNAFIALNRKEEFEQTNEILSRLRYIKRDLFYQTSRLCNNQMEQRPLNKLISEEYNNLQAVYTDSIEKTLNLIIDDMRYLRSYERQPASPLKTIVVEADHYLQCCEIAIASGIILVSLIFYSFNPIRYKQELEKKKTSQQSSNNNKKKRSHTQSKATAQKQESVSSVSSSSSSSNDNNTHHQIPTSVKTSIQPVSENSLKSSIEHQFNDNSKTNHTYTVPKVTYPQQQPIPSISSSSSSNSTSNETSISAKINESPVFESILNSTNDHQSYITIENPSPKSKKKTHSKWKKKDKSNEKHEKHHQQIKQTSVVSETSSSRQKILINDKKEAEREAKWKKQQHELKLKAKELRKLENSRQQPPTPIAKEKGKEEDKGKQEKVLDQNSLEALLNKEVIVYKKPIETPNYKASKNANDHIKMAWVASKGFEDICTSINNKEYDIHNEYDKMLVHLALKYHLLCFFEAFNSKEIQDNDRVFINNHILNVDEATQCRHYIRYSHIDTVEEVITFAQYLTTLKLSSLTKNSNQIALQEPVKIDYSHFIKEFPKLLLPRQTERILTHLSYIEKIGNVLRKQDPNLNNLLEKTDLQAALKMCIEIIGECLRKTPYKRDIQQFSFLIESSNKVAHSEKKCTLISSSSNRQPLISELHEIRITEIKAIILEIKEIIAAVEKNKKTRETKG